MLLDGLIAFLVLQALPSVYGAPSPRPRIDDGSAPGELIGDLLNGITSPIGQLTRHCEQLGQTISDIIIGDESGQSNVKTSKPKPCKATDPCCVWYDVSADLTAMFTGIFKRCNNQARAAIRLGFHDAGTWSKTNKAKGEDFGGADGSIILGFNEENRAENNGLQEIIQKLQKLRTKYKVSAADLVQYAAIHATVTCPLGPRVRAFVGRIDATRAAPEGLLPSMKSPADVLIALFRDKTIGPHELAALVGAHSTSRQFTQDGARVGAPQDSTPAVWDVAFYNETIQPSPRKKLFIFQSDIALANHPDTKDEWNSFIGDQKHWNEDYATAYIRLSLLGVNNINSLTECTATLPAARPVFAGSGEVDAVE